MISCDVNKLLQKLCQTTGDQLYLPVPNHQRRIALSLTDEESF
jgi:D-ribose pyranose/furanose isomerase RbsD